MPEQVILVDASDNEIGTEEKIAAHRAGKLHRAFSVFVFNSRGQMLLQKRALGKYHSGGLWTNACCSHPRPGELNVAAARRRLKEEMGFDCPLRKVHSFVYRAPYDNGLTEHEYDHVFVGQFDGIPKPDLAEVEEWKWVDIVWLMHDIEARPEKYTAWFKVCLEKVLEFVKS